MSPSSTAASTVDSVSTPTRERWFDRVDHLRLFACALLAGATLIWGLLLARVPAFTQVHVLSVFAMVLLFFITERWPVAIAVRRTAPSVGMSAAPLVIGLFYAPTWAIIVGYLVGSLLAVISRRQLRDVGVMFGIAQFAFFAALATIGFRLVSGPSPSPSGVLSWNAYGAVYLAALVLILTSLSTSFMMALQDGLITRSLALQNLGIAAAGIGCATSYGLLAVELVWSNPKGLLVACVLGAVLLAGCRALLFERRERRVAEFLRGADEALHHSGELESAIVGLIGRAREMFEAQIVQLTIYPSAPGEKAYRTTVRTGGARAQEVMVPIELTDLDDILEADSDGVIIDRSSTSAASRGVLQRRGVDHAMVAVLRGQTRLIGSLMVGSHVSARSFDQRDLQLFQTLAIQTSSTLENGRLEHSIARLTDLQEQLSHQAFHDSLTDLANRALFTDRIEHALLRRTRTGNPVAVLFIDLDDFKTVNDTLGHAAGDQLLIGVAERLRLSLRRPDTAARFGGDEFAVLIEDIDTAAEAELVADRIFAALQQPFTVAGQAVTVHASIGVALSDGADSNANELLRHADVAMYAAKAAGKRRRVRFASGMETEIVARHRLRADLERAVAGEEFGVHYQPVVDLNTGQMVGTEALVRWRHPTRGMVAPDEFISVAEESGVILALGEQVLRQACAAALRWQARHPAPQPLWVSVNISARQLQQPLFIEQVLDIVNASGLRPTSLVLELTESILLIDAGATIAKLEALKRAGIRVAIDDFGTGYSSLSYLRHLPVDILKIAKPFVDDMATGRRGSDMARAIVGIGSALHLTMIAEGIETLEQLIALRELGCALGQGYHMARPLAPERLDELLDAGGIDAARLGLALPRPGSIVQLPAAR